MSLLEVPPFESLTQGTSPYSGFGPLVTDTETINNFSRIVSEGSARISQTFGMSFPPDRSGIAGLEALISRIWEEGWDPDTSDVNLFVRDFGSIFMSLIQAMTTGEPVFRSRTDLSHASLWWSTKRLEVFPFHKMYRRFTDREGESLLFFVDGLGKKLAVKPGTHS